MAFDGWPESMVAFYSELEVNNTKEFWEANRAVYDADVRAPMEALVAELEPEFGVGKIFRPYRDVRFSKDKTPYKTEVAAVFSTADGAGWYVRANADGLAAGGGYHRLARDQLERFRAAMADEVTGNDLAARIAAVEQRMAVHSDSLKTAPRGYAKDHPRIELLRRKSLTFMREEPPGPVLRSREALTFVVDAFRDGAPLMDWLDQHVGGSTEPARGR